MYIIDLMKRLTHKNNIPLLLYLLLNVFIIVGIISSMFGSGFGISLVTGVILYAISLLGALSPFGEWILRLQTGCHKLREEDDHARIESLFKEVYAKAKGIEPSLPGNIQIYINDEVEPNAFATGRRTICLTKGFLAMPDEEIKATLGHEFGHLSHKDTDLILLVTVGNMIITGVILCIRFFLEIFRITASAGAILAGGSDGLVGMLTTSLYHLFTTIFVSSLTWIWTKIGILFVMKASRSNELYADEFSVDLGYGEALYQVLNRICPSGKKGLFANLASSHPNKKIRIRHLQELGVNI